MTIQFLTDQWASALTSAANGDDGFRAAAAGQQVVLQVGVSSSPWSDEYYMHFDNGQLTVGIGGAPQSHDVDVQMPYETNVALSKGELNGQTAAMTGQMKVHGDMMKMMMIGKAQARLSEIEAGLDIEYQP
jgi:putative sterol carrier protein